MSIRWDLTALATILLCGCATTEQASRAPGNEAAPPAVLGLRFERMSWGNVVEAWEVKPDGRGTRTIAESVLRDARKHTQQLSGESSDFLEILGALRPAFGRLSTGVSCAAALPPDADSISITWIWRANSSEFSFYNGCNSPEADEIRAGVAKAAENIRAIAKPK